MWWWGSEPPIKLVYFGRIRTTQLQSRVRIPPMWCYSDGEGAIFFAWSIDYRQIEIYSRACQHAVAPPLKTSIPIFERRRTGAHVGFVGTKYFSGRMSCHFCMADLIKSESLRGTIPRANLSDLGTIKICADRLVLYGSQSRTMTVRYVWIRLSHCFWYCHFWL